jgi:uncharacterized protein involved in exopolysaccharide biosynthesis
METAVTPTSDDEIDLSELWQTIWSGRWLIAMITSVFALGGVAYAFLAQEWYKAEVVLAPANQQSLTGGNLAGLGLGLGGLASLAGITLPSSSDQQPVAVLKSKDFARDFIEDQDLTRDLVKEVRNSNSLDIRDAVRVFVTRVRGVTEDTKTGLVTLSIRWKDADTAALWANTLARRLNDRLRQQAAEAAERNVTYLKKEMTATSIVSLQQSMGSILEAEMQKLMLARGNDEFAFKVIDQAVAPKQRDAPRRVLIILVATFAGGFLSVLILGVRKVIRSRSRA